MFSQDAGNPVDFDTLAEAHNSSKASIHIRFKALDSKLRKELDLSMKRTCIELFDEGFCSDTYFDIQNYRNLDRYPFSEVSEKIEVFENFNPDVFVTESLVSAISLSKDSVSLKERDLFRLLYNEQFTYRVSALLFSEKSPDEVGEVIRHILNNADITGVSLLSIELKGDVDGATVMDLVPDNNDYPAARPLDMSGDFCEGDSSQIIKQIEHEPLKEKSFVLSESIMSTPVMNVVTDPTKNRLSEGGRLVLQSGASIELVSGLRVIESDNMPHVFSQPGDSNKPIWIIGSDDGEDDLFIIHLVAQTKAPGNVDEWERAVADFPCYPFWSLDNDAALYMPLAVSDIGFVSDWMANGLMVSTDFDELGRVRYMVHINEESDSSIEEVVCCVGTLRVIKLFLDELKDLDPNKTKLEEIIFLGQKVGGDPEVIENIPERTVH
jgi:hypothetical protein